jgi:RNA polymerase sigma-70 factor, ECF subfamily
MAPYRWSPAAVVDGQLIRSLPRISSAEAELIDRCISGDHQAWESLLSRYQNRVYNLAYHMTQDRERASDLAQEAMIQIVHSLPRFRGDASLGTWIHGLTMRVCLHHLRRERSRPTEFYDDLDSASEQIEATDLLPHEVVSREQVQHTVQAAIAALPLKFRSVMALHGLAGLTYEETAQVLGLPVNTVKTRVYRAKGKLRTTLRALLEGDEHGL